MPAALERAFKEAAHGRVSEFAPTVWLTEKQSPGNPGFYRLDLAPYGVGMMDSWHDNRWDEEHWIKSAQCGVTEIALMILRFICKNEPGNAAYLLESKEEVRKVSKVRFIATLRQFAEINEQLPANDDDISASFLELRDMVVHFLGSHAEGSLENKPLVAIFLDELAKHLQRPGSPDTVTQSRERFKTLKGKKRKLYSLTKPGEQRGIEHREYMTGTRDKFKIPCPTCGRRQELVFERLRYDHCMDRKTGFYDLQRVLDETWYECETGCRIEHHQKLGMMMAALAFPEFGWEHTNTETGKWAPKPRKRSRHISDLYSAFCSWGELAVEWIGCGDDPTLQAAFYIGRLGRWPALEAGEVTEHALRRLCKPLAPLLPYDRGSLPIVPRVCALHVDVQDTHLKHLIAAYLANGDMFVADFGYSTDFGDLLRKAGKQEIRCPDGSVVRPQVMFVDEGERTHEVREFVVAADDRFQFGAYTVKGARSKETKNAVWATKVIVPGGRTHHAYYFRDFLIKKAFYIVRLKRVIELLKKLDDLGPDKMKPEDYARLQRLPKIWFPRDVEESFLRELSAERLAIVNDREVWIDPETSNDWGDAAKQCTILLHCIGPQIGASVLTLDVEAAEAAEV